MKKNNGEKNLKSNNNFSKYNKILLIIVIIFIILLASGFIYSVLKKDKNQLILTDSEKEYRAIINAYGDSASLAVDNYIKNNNGSIPTWSDIEENIPSLSKQVSCDNYINYDGSIYLSNCIVSGLDYTSEYTYGKKLDEPTSDNDNIYVYSYYENNQLTYTSSDYQYDVDEYTLVNTYQCESDLCKSYDLDSLNNQIILYDKQYYLYNYFTQKKEVIDLGDEIYDNIQFLSSSKNTYGLSIKNEQSKIAFYNLTTKKYLTNFIYDNVQTYNINELLDSSYYAGFKYDENNNSNLYIISQSNGNIIKTLSNIGTITSEMVGNKIIYITTPLGDYSIYTLYNSSFIPLIDNTQYYYAINSNNTITVYEDKNNTVFYQYDNTGSLLTTSQEYQEIVKIVKDYIIVLDQDNNLKLLDLNESVITNFLKVTDEYILHPLISGWYTENGKNGIYMVVQNQNIPYGTEGSGLEYYYIPSTKESGVIKTVGVGGYAKPVLYLYPTKKTNVSITFSKPYLLTTTYPKYQQMWNVTAYPNGDLYDQNNQYYYGLYWEETGSSNVDFSEGFYVTSDNAQSFLDDVTEKIGFTRREANEFIMYWLPILEKNEKNLVYFELTEERNNYNQLIINPTPDSLLRVAIHVKKVDKYTKIKEQVLTKFTRVGFTVVEWGGVEH